MSTWTIVLLNPNPSTLMLLVRASLPYVCSMCTVCAKPPDRSNADLLLLLSFFRREIRLKRCFPPPSFHIHLSTCCSPLLLPPPPISILYVCFYAKISSKGTTCTVVGGGGEPFSQLSSHIPSSLLFFSGAERASSCSLPHSLSFPKKLISFGNEIMLLGGGRKGNL